MTTSMLQRGVEEAVDVPHTRRNNTAQPCDVGGPADADLGKTTTQKLPNNCSPRAPESSPRRAWRLLQVARRTDVQPNFNHCWPILGTSCTHLATFSTRSTAFCAKRWPGLDDTWPKSTDVGGKLADVLARVGYVWPKIGKCSKSGPNRFTLGSRSNFEQLSAYCRACTTSELARESFPKRMSSICSASLSEPD